MPSGRRSWTNWIGCECRIARAPSAARFRNNRPLSSPKMTTSASVLERIEEGKKRREIAARTAHAHLHAKERKFDPIAVLLASGADRVRRLLPVKYARMHVSPFAFFR